MHACGLAGGYVFWGLFHDVQKKDIPREQCYYVVDMVSLLVFQHQTLQWESISCMLEA